MSRVGAFFDVDRTIVSCNTGRLFLRDLRRRGEISLFRTLRALVWMAKYHLSLIDLQWVAARIAGQMEGKLEREFADRCRGWVKTDVLPLVVPGARDKIAKHRADGHVLAILSTSPSYVTEPLAEVLGIDEVMSTRLEVKGGQFTGRLLGPACVGPGKVHWAEDLVARRQLDLKQSWFYTDSYTDMPMLERVGNQVVVNPDPRLRRIAKRRGWPVQDWRQAAAAAAEVRASVYSAPWYTPAVQRLLDLALEEDVGRGDVTTSSVIDETQEAEAEIIARERAVVCGLGVVEAVFTRFDWRTRVRMKVSDGDPIAPGGVVASVRGPASALLAGERTALNFLQRLSGIATLTQAFVSASEGAKVRVTDTRKTTPGLRALEKYAVRVGGGASHRSDLASGVLLKDNHIALVGSVREAVRRARANAPHVLRVVVEVDDLAQLEEALEAGAEGILLDNFQVRDMAEAVKRVRERRSPVVLEASGGVTLDRIREITKTGVDVVSIGSITHSARAIDFSCEIRPTDGARTRIVGVAWAGVGGGWGAALAIAAAASGCDEGGPPVRGFHSRQLVSIRDPTLFLVGFGSKVVTVETENGPSSRQVTDPDIAYYKTGDSAQTYWKMNLADGTVTELGDRIVTSQPPGPATRFNCRYEGNGTGVYTLVVADGDTRQDLASIDRVVSLGGCPRYPDRYLAVVRLDENEVGRLWTGPFDSLVRAELDLAIDQHLRGNWSYEPDPAKWRMTVLATAGSAPAGRGIYAIDLAQLTAEAVILPALPDVIWAPGAAPSGSVRSDGLAPEDVAIVYGSGGNDTYLYRRHMNDGSEVMFAGPLSSPAPRELALFPMAGQTASVLLAVGNGVPIQGNVFTWQQIGASGSDTDLLVNWDTASQRIISCPLAPGTLLGGPGIPSDRLVGKASPDRSRYVFGDVGALGVSTGDLFGPLVEVSLAGAGSCTLRASKDVKSAVIADEAVAWIEWPEGSFSQTLWLAGAPGDAPRAIGSMTLLEGPTFIAANTLQVQLGTDVVWFDVRDDPVKLHYVAEGTFGRPSSGPRWVIVGYDLSSQDDTGTLGVVDWHTGEKRPISPAVEDYMASTRDSSERPISIVYRVRGRSASALDGLWAATIDAGDLPE